MQSVSCSRWLPYPAQNIYQLLTDPHKLTLVVKRLKSIQVLERHNETTGKVLAKLDLPGGKTLETIGQVIGTADCKIIFSAEAPIPLEIKWELSPESQNGDNGTQVSYSIGVDFSPIAAFISGIVLKGYLSSEMEKDLFTLEDLLSKEPLLA